VAGQGNAQTPPPASAPDPVGERAAALREAASLLDKAAAARARGNRSFAEQLFSSAELIVGPEAVAELSAVFREGAPPRVTTPLKVLPKDTPPQPDKVGASDDDEPDAKPKRGSLAGVVEVGGQAGGALGVVTLEPLGKKAKRRTPKLRVMEQRERQFAPRVLVVPVGSTVQFPNFDPVFHNVFSTSPTTAFDLGLYKNGEAREVRLDKEGVLRLGCNLHANMAAHIVVVAAPHYVTTDAKGEFRFRSLEPGKYLLSAWSEKSKTPITQEIEIKAGPNQVKVGVSADAETGPAPDKFGVSRGKGG
jgi:plastocyanin